MDTPNTTSGSIIQFKNGDSLASSLGLSDSSTGFFSNGSKSSGDSSTGFFSGLANISLTTWVIIFLILSFLGFNIFVYLAKGTQDISSFLAPFMEKIFGATANLTGQVVDVSAEGGKAVVGGTASAINAGLTSVQNITPNNASTSIQNQSVQNTIQQPDIMANNTLNKALNTSQNQGREGPNNEYQANESSSTLLQNGGTTGKSGWCYIGEEKGFRTCGEVTANDECMSGDIFPTHEICVNPNLRS